ncbi:DUF4214 domain-containing protein [Salinarimonas ramus]|uniref:DUF4214 domain-containing protein n=1 Tax=Salinarimonas ramus TaxID=690164 RepID=A0A917QCT9_9HYPH|nr:DUF4214 domain-containing protein [Salinarimonas ramus]GGK43734.1 hypothetical protein GCM10011322_33500 [Salinarimonas ramus]
MADITIFNGQVNGTPGNDVFRTTVGLSNFSVNAGSGNDQFVADVSHLAGVTWEVLGVETFTFFGSRETIFFSSFGSFPKTIDFSGVSSLALATIRDGFLTNTVIGGPLTAAGFSSSLTSTATLQTMDFNTGVAVLNRTNGETVAFNSSALPVFFLIDGVNSSTTGSAANNAVHVAHGVHTFNGGAGVDSVAIRFETMGAQIGQFQVLSRPDDTLTITNPTAARPFSVEAGSVERVQFIDGQGAFVRTLAFDTGAGENAGSAYRVYQAAFDRTPDNDGLKFWIDRADGGTSLIDIAAGFVASAEFQSIYGANPTSAQFVGRLYQNVLGREGEAGGVAFWTNELNTGARSQAQVLADFAESPENVVGVAPAIDGGIVLL